MKRYLFLLFFCLPFCGKGQIIETIAGNGANTGEGIPAITADIPRPGGGDFDCEGNYYFVTHHQIFKIDTLGNLFTVAGNSTSGFSGDGGLATSAELGYVYGFTIDQNGNMYICDFDNYRIRKIDAITKIITTIAGNGTPTSTGSGGLATNATVFPIGDICADVAGNVYFKDSFVYVRMIDTAGIITTVAGNGNGNYSGDGGLAIMHLFQ